MPALVQALFLTKGTKDLMGNLLSSINSPDDLKKLNNEALKQLCAEIREFLIESVSHTGGHLASNLGIVELTVAIHKVFDLPNDKLIFDVGHQSYVHKILTGRRDDFKTLRQFGGISGFPKRAESEYDAFNTGHSSTSISAALGLARARDLSGEKHNILAVFGDGALTGGMMYEAMNDAGHSKTPLILILNDNEMSISKNVGAIAKHLRKLRSSSLYFKSKDVVERFLQKLPVIGKPLDTAIRYIKRGIRNLVIPTSLFDELGFYYMGPVDGHNIELLISSLEYAKQEQKPVVVHVQTKKGKGYLHAENNPQKFHGIPAFNKETGETAASVETYSDCFGKKLTELAAENEKIVAITGAMPNGTGLDMFADKFKSRFFDVGIAEQHGVTLCAGLAASGYIPVIPLYSSFLQRAYDQVLHDVCLQNLHVVFPIDRAGIVGSDGETHQGVYDISYLSHMPNMTILSPSSFKELEEMLDYAINTHNGPIAIRYPRGSQEAEYMPFEYPKSVTVKSGKDVSIIATGRMLKTATDICDILSKDNISCEIVALPVIKPFDKAAVIAAALKTGRVITIEDNVKLGGIGYMCAQTLCENEICTKFKAFAFPDVPIVHGTVAELDKFYGLDSQTIANEVRKWVK